MCECIEDVNHERRIAVPAIIDLPQELVDEAQEIHKYRQASGDDVDLQDLLLEHADLQPVFFCDGDRMFDEE